ncbi:MAG: 30S ribosomal protein S9 [Chloroflexi bacterium]|nr:30S ribosomal protein S9 [Chloroflexota bacterium]MCL5074942.1 30S ribosomal protein S9 [Chloroflexota bacterium]
MNDKVDDKAYHYGTGRRKTAIARVRLYPGDGQITINDKPLEGVFPRKAWQVLIQQPLHLTDMADKINVIAKVAGGGCSGQAEAIRHGIARALTQLNDSLRPLLRQAGLLTRDPRAKERKKYGLKRARKAPQYTKR